MENFSKNKKGRPVKNSLFYEPEYYKTINEFWGKNVKTRRGMYNIFLAVKAINLFNSLKDAKYKFIFDYEKQTFKKTILAELGKVIIDYSENEALKIAGVICKNKLSTGEAINYIRRLRGVRKEKNKIDDVSRCIITILNNAMLPKNQLLEILENTYNFVVNHFNETNID